MGLLDQLWDDTLAGPRPDTGLGKLRKHSTFSFRSNSGKGRPPQNHILNLTFKSQSGASGFLGIQFSAQNTGNVGSVSVVGGRDCEIGRRSGRGRQGEGDEEHHDSEAAGAPDSKRIATRFAGRIYTSGISLRRQLVDVPSIMEKLHLVMELRGSPSFRFRRRSTSDALGKASGIGTRSPRPPYEL
ncbi:hypothetical protein RJ639_038088 [Escallonia herrerae]|uniref:Uncharacterized protein n=1 Tax=Escallonia herrerae TaxID=1293975 RepID=A0AA88WP33_9ASTE|nr:hypothetical protein RJ639_038088 [Escallonia herrerae]